MQEEDSEDESFIQRVTIKAGNNLYRHRHSPPVSHHSSHSHHSHHSEPGSSGWRISPIPWRMMIADTETTYPEPGPSSAENYHIHDRDRRDQYLGPYTSNKRSHEEVSFQGYPHLKRIKSSPASDIDDIDRRISMAGKIDIKYLWN